MKFSKPVYDETLNTQIIEYKEYRVTEVVLESDTQDPDRINPFMCDSCGRMLAQYTGNIFRKIPEGTPVDLRGAFPTIVVYCKLCKRRYLITNVL